MPRGGGTQDAWGGPLRRADLHLDLSGLSGVVAYEPSDLTVTVRAGTRLAELQAALAERGQWLPLDPPFPERATVGGVVAGGAYGPWRHLHGGPRDLVIGLRAVLASGEVVRTGGRVVKNVAGFDLGKAFVGSFGTLGVISECSLRVRPLPGPRCSLRAAFGRRGDAWAATAALLGSELIPSAIAWEGGALTVAFEEANAYQARRLGELCAGADIAEVGDAVWDAVRAFPCGADLALRVNVPAAALEATVDGLAAAGFATLSYPGLGTVWAVGGEGATFAAGLACARACGGHAIAIACPQDVDPWGAAGELLPLFGSLKQRFDPGGTLNPGRFIGGI